MPRKNEPDSELVPRLAQKQRDAIARWIESALQDMKMGELNRRVEKDWAEFDLEPPGRNIHPGCSNRAGPAARMACQQKAVFFDQGILRAASAYKIRTQQQASAEAPEQAARASLQQAYWRWKFESDLGLTQLFRSMIVPLCVQGYIPVRIRRRKRFEYRPVFKTGGQRPVIEPVLIRDGADVELVWYKNFRCDVLAKSIEEAPYVGEAITVPASELDHLAETQPGFDRTAVRAAIESERTSAMGGGSGANRASDSSQAVDIETPEIEREDNPLVAIEAWYAEVPAELTGDPGPVRYFGWYHAGTRALLYVNYLLNLDVQNRYPYEVPILVPAYSESGGRRWWGLGIPAFYRPIAEINEEQLNRMIDGAFKANNPPILKSGNDFFLRTYTPMWAPNAVWPCEDPRKSIMYAEMPPTDHASQVELYGVFSQLYKLMTATFDSTQGDLDSLKSHTTSQAVNQIVGAAHMPHAVDALRTAEQLQTILRRVAAIERGVLEEYPSEQQLTFRIVGEQGGIAVMSATPADLLGEYEFEFDTSGLDSQARASNLMQSIQIIGASPVVQLFPERINALVVELLKLLQVPWEGFAVTEEDAKARQAEVQAEALAKALSKADPEQLAAAISQLPPQYLLQLPPEVITALVSRLATIAAQQQQAGQAAM